MSGLVDLMMRRHSCRSFSDKPVEDAKLVSCINAARLAPSALNEQAWHFYVVNEAEKSAHVAELTQVAGFNKWTSACPAVIILTQTGGNLASNLALNAAHYDFRQIDMGLAAMALTLEAEEQGLGTCMVGLFNEEKLKMDFRIPSNRKIMLVIAVGYEAGSESHPKKRRELEEIVSYL